MSDVTLHLGLDDIDSPSGGCTTHFASRLVEELERSDVRWLDYPGLIRLNPGIPYRTRGNGAVVLRIEIEEDRIEQLIEYLQSEIAEYADLEYPNTNPGFAIVRDRIPQRLRLFSKQALWRTLPVSLAKRTSKDLHLKHCAFGNGRGLIGALAAIGNNLEYDHTYELIAYRSLDDSKEDRGVNPESVRRMDSELQNQVFANIDPSDGRMLIEPHGPDPVLFGVRGESPDAVKKAAFMVEAKQSIERWMIFRTNQATGEHLANLMKIHQLRPYMAARVEGFVDRDPRIIEGGHVIFGISDDHNSIDCAVYEPTRQFRDVANQLLVGDKVILHGSVRPASRTHDITLNVEGINLVELVPEITQANPTCPACGKRMKSAGREKGYKCSKCGHRERNGEKIITQQKRALKSGLYLPPLNTQRHLTRPLQRLSKENRGIPATLLEKWHSP